MSWKGGSGRGGGRGTRQAPWKRGRGNWRGSRGNSNAGGKLPPPSQICPNSYDHDDDDGRVSQTAQVKTLVEFLVETNFAILEGYWL
jgi:hypothetical protein